MSSLQEAILELMKPQPHRRQLWMRPVSWRTRGVAFCLDDDKHFKLVPSFEGGKPARMPSAREILGRWEAVSPDEVNEGK